MDKNGRDLRELVFGDTLASTPERELQAISSRPESQEELNRLLALRELLLSVGEEEPPRRTVLVAPETPKAPLWRSFFGFGSPGWAFAGTLALAIAVISHGFLARPPVAPTLVAQQPAAEVAAPVVTSSPAGLTRTLSAEEIDARVHAELERRMPAVVQQVRAEMQGESSQETARLVAAAEERLRQQHENEMFEMREAVYFMKKQFGRQMVANVALASEVQ